MKAPILSLHKLFCFSTFIFLFTCNKALAITKTSAGSGNWSTGANWIPAGVPVAGDDVVIVTGHTVVINVNTANLASLTIDGTLIIGNNNTNRTVRSNGDITVNATGSFLTAGNGGNRVRIGGNLVNDGIFDMNIGGADAEVEFIGNSNQNLTGTGGTTDFITIEINNNGAVNDNIVEIKSTAFTASNGFLTLTDGILKMSGSFTFSNTFFNSANPTINSASGIWLNNSNVTVTGQNGDTRLDGLIRITDGTYNIGVTADWWLYYYSGAELVIEGGALNISGVFCGASSTQTIKYTQSGGVVTVNTAGNTYSVASFEIWASGSVFNMSGGSIEMQRPASAFTDYVNFSTNATITGGKIQAGNSLTPMGSVFWINSTPPLYDLAAGATNSPSFQLRNSITVLHDVIISGTLDAASQNVDINVGHDWINNGVFLPASTGTVTFNGTSPQTIGGSVTTGFKNININNTGGGITLNESATVSGTASFTNGLVTISGTRLLTFQNDAIAIGANNGANPSYVHGPVCKIGDDAFTFPVGKSGAGYHPCSISAPALNTDAFTAEYMRVGASSLGPISATGLYVISHCEYWDIDRTTGTSNVDVTLSWNGFSNCNAAAYVTDPASLVVAHFNGGSWDNFGADSYTGTVSSGTVTWNNVSVFSPFSLGSNNPATNPLTVKFTSVKAYSSGVNNVIEWSNVEEQGVNIYAIEKSTDGNNFYLLDSIAARGNSGNRVDYSFTDRMVQGLTSWYRIRAVEWNGAITISPIVKVNRQTDDLRELKIFPNPVTGRQLNIQLLGEKNDIYTITIIDQAGRKVLRADWLHPAGNASVSLNLPETISRGYYIIYVTGKERNFVSKLVVQ